MNQNRTHHSFPKLLYTPRLLICLITLLQETSVAQLSHKENENSKKLENSFEVGGCVFVCIVKQSDAAVNAFLFT